MQSTRWFQVGFGHKCFLVMAVAMAFSPQFTAKACAQNTNAQTQQLSPAQQEILNRLRSSGLSRQQAKQQLRTAGYDPNLVDAYYDRLSAGDSTTADGRVISKYTRELPEPTGSMLAALRSVGVLTPIDSTVERVRADTVRKDVRPKRPEELEPQIFGRELFAASTQFEPIVAGPIDPDYRLGPGDELTLLVTGDVELGYDLTVTREGYIVIPDVGQVIVNGLTLAEARRRLNERLGRVYSGVRLGTTQSDITVGKLRSKLVYVIGEAEVPGAYPLNGTATVFSALYRAGGPSVNGSFRHIEVRRGNRVIRQVDLYDYLLNGDKSGDVVLEQGDVVFIPVVGPQVTVAGSVRRPAIFELNGNEGLADVMRFAGGAGADAALERIQIDRILPVGQRKPGREYALVDIDLTSLSRGAVVPMQDGDHVLVFKLDNTHRNRVWALGELQRPGTFEYRPGMTALDLVKAAQGLLESAHTPSAQIVRPSMKDGSTRMVHVVLDDPSSPDYAGKVVVEDLDRLWVFGRDVFVNPMKVEIFGEVKKPGIYDFSEGMTAQDLIMLADGFNEGADEYTVEVARRVISPNRRDTVATVTRVGLDMRLSSGGTGSQAGQFVLTNGDQVFVRRIPGYQPLMTVSVNGEVNYPGNYTVRSRIERVSDVVRRAGGLTAEAYARGFQLFRDNKLVALDFPKILRHPGGADDIAVVPGDRIEIPRYDPTVLVTGAVAFESRVRYQPGLDLADYLSRAGGVTDTGNKGKASVRYANGELRTVSHTLGFRRTPNVEPGSVIVVPTKDKTSAFDLDRFLTKTMTLLSTLATVAVAANALK